MSATDLKVEIVRGGMAPRYDPTKTKELTLTKAIITEQGTASKLPLVDFVFTDSDGQEYFTMVTGRIINTVSAAIRGVNMRIHGIEEP